MGEVARLRSGSLIVNYLVQVEFNKELRLRGTDCNLDEEYEK